MMAVTTKNNSLKWVISIGIVIIIYSLSYFYSMMPYSDSQYFRGLTEYFIKTKNLDPSQLNHYYYQWPSFFILANIATSVSGLELANFEFLLYAIIGFLLATTLHVYAFKAYKNGGFLAVAAFFTSMLYILNYQCVPFALALGLFFLLLMLETQQRSPGVMLTMLVLFTGISITHVFVPLFFVLYLLVRSILNRSKQYRNLFLLTLSIYLLVQVTQAPFSFASSIHRIINMLSSANEYPPMAQATLAPVSVPIDAIAQMFSRTVTIAVALICVAGFIFLLVKRKMRALDKAILLAGAVYSGFGVLLNNLGERAIPIAFIPISLGAAYLFEGRFRPYLKYIFLVLLTLSAFIPLHMSFSNEIQFQTQEAYKSENFMIDHYNWTKPSFILADFRVITYLESVSVASHFSSEPQTVKEVDTIFYTVGLGKDFSGYENYTVEELFQEEKLNMVYNNGFSYLAMKISNFTYASTR
jgi:hypothetical protein